MRIATSFSTGIALCGLALLATAATARFDGTPTTTDHGTTLAVRGEIVDLPARDMKVRLSATGTATVACANPSGKRVEAQKKTARVTLNGSQEILASDVVNGRVAFDVATDPMVTSGKHLCPSDQWTPLVDDVKFESVTLRVVQDGNVVLIKTWNL